MKTKPLLITTAIIESTTGLALLLVPQLPVLILIGAQFDKPAHSVVGRITGAALLALGLASWSGAHEHTPATTGIVSALLLYNVATVAVLAYAGIGLQLWGIGLWPAVVLHAVMASWCLSCLQTSGLNSRAALTGVPRQRT